MDNRLKTGMALTLSVLLVGCSNQQFKPASVLCPLVGAVTGAGVLGAATDSDEAGVYVGGAVLGGALGYFLCHEKEPLPADSPLRDPAIEWVTAPKGRRRINPPASLVSGPWR